MGPICSTCVHSQIHLHYMCKIVSQSVQPFDHIFQSFELLTPQIHPKCHPGLSWSELFLAYVHVQVNPQTCTKCVANRSSLWQLPKPVWQLPLTFECLTHLKPPKCLLVSLGANCLTNIHSQMDMHKYQIWCQSVQPFHIFPWLLNLTPITPLPKCRGANCI